MEERKSHDRTEGEKGEMTRGERQNLIKGLRFTFPWILGLLLFVLYPVLASLYYSLTNFNVFLKPVFIGLENYKNLFEDQLFWKTSSNTLFYAMIALPLSLAFALGIAILLNQPVKMRSVFRTIFFLPSLVPLVALAILWLWIFNGQYGILNFALRKILLPLGLDAPNWIGDPRFTKPALILMGLWGVGGSVVIYLAALQDVPAHLYEAAEIDGAGALVKFRHVTLPLISPVIYFNLVMGIIGTLQIFAVPYIMFQRGPANSTYFFSMYIYDNAFKYLKMGYASALAWIMFLLIFLLTLVATRISRSRIYYGGEQ